MEKFEIVKLKWLHEKYPKSKVKHMLNNFTSNDEDLQNWLRHIALQDEINRKSKTILILDKKHTKILLYFTLKPKSLSLIGMSNKDKKIFGGIHGTQASIGVILLAQLSKDKKCGNIVPFKFFWDVISNTINFELEFTYQYVILDCKKEMISYYEKIGFTKIADDNLNDLKTMIINAKILGTIGE